MMGTCLWHCVGPDKESPAETMYTFIVSIDCEDTGDNRTHCLHYLTSLVSVISLVVFF